MEADVVTTNDADLRYIPHDQIDPYEEQPRKWFDEEKTRELANSIRVQGQNTAIIVTQRPGSNRYILIGGERRWRACGLISVEDGEPFVMKAVFERYVDEDWLFQTAFVDNANREDMQPLEEAEGFLRLRESGKTVEQIATVYSKSVAYVYNYISLTSLDERVKALMHPKRSKNIRLGVTHAIELAKIGDVETQVLLAMDVVETKMTVKALVTEVDKLIVSGGRRKRRPSERRREVKRALTALGTDLTRLSVLSEVDIRDLFDVEGDGDIDFESMMFTLQQMQALATGKREPIMKPSCDVGGTILKTNMSADIARRYWMSRADPDSEPRFLLEIAYPGGSSQVPKGAPSFLAAVRGIFQKDQVSWEETELSPHGRGLFLLVNCLRFYWLP